MRKKTSLHDRSLSAFCFSRKHESVIFKAKCRMYFLFLSNPPSFWIRADQNTGGALLQSPMRTAMQRKSRVSSAISVELKPSGLGVGVVTVGWYKLMFEPTKR